MKAKVPQALVEQVEVHPDGVLQDPTPPLNTEFNSVLRQRLKMRLAPKLTPIILVSGVLRVGKRDSRPWEVQEQAGDCSKSPLIRRTPVNTVISDILCFSKLSDQIPKFSNRGIPGGCVRSFVNNSISN